MKYKIEKKIGVYTNGNWFLVFRRKRYFWWERIGSIYPTLEEAKEIIYQDMRSRQKPEIVAYFQ